MVSDQTRDVKIWGALTVGSISLLLIGLVVVLGFDATRKDRPREYGDEVGRLHDARYPKDDVFVRKIRVDGGTLYVTTQVYGYAISTVFVPTPPASK